ncbi:MAG: hypothetical protein HY899_19595 [Deltaproteobacteria bacterium]|nr:hypothetical protein [Deltaproteobacteria bacterium]
MSAAALAAIVFNAALAAAQPCPNVAGNPAPTPEPNLTQKLILRAGPGGVWGDGNECYRLLKGIVTTATPWSVDIDLRELDPANNQYLIKKARRWNVNLDNMPLASSDNLHVMLEVWDDWNNGICLDSTLTRCNGTATTTCWPD